MPSGSTQSLVKAPVSPGSLHELLCDQTPIIDVWFDPVDTFPRSYEAAYSQLHVCA